MKSTHFFAIAILLSPAIAFSQDIFTLSGKVINTENKPVAAGELSILNETDSAVVKKANILKGEFVFEPVEKGRYLLKVVSLGFKDKLQLLSLDESKSITVSLEPSASLLDQVTVSGAKKTFVNRNGNMLVNVENSPLAAIPDAVNLLSKIPLVQVSPDGETISIVGKGQPLIYIDNQKMSMQDLKSMPVGDIKTIEIINNPSSKYEAEGRTVVLVTRKQNHQEGLKGDLTENAGYRRYYLNRSAANLSMKKKKLELKTNIQYNQLRTWEGNAFDMQILNRGIDTRYSVTAVTTRPQFIGEVGAYYQINEGDYISLSANGRTQNESFPIYTNSSLQDAAHREEVLTSTYNRNPDSYYTSRLNYNKKFKTGNLFIGAQQTGYDRRLNTAIYNNYDQSGDKLTQNRKQNSHIGVLAGRVDFENTFHEKLKWESGVSATQARSNGITDIVNTDPVEQTNATYQYREKNLAAYSQLTRKIRKVNYSAGVRLENTNVLSTYNDNQTPSEIRKNYTRLFPKASASLNLDSSNSITVSYARSISRPDYSNANQTAIYINPYFEWSSNINLNPSYTDQVDATYQFKDYSASLVVYRATDAVYDRFQYNDRDGILRRSETNYEEEIGTQLTLTLPFKLGLWTSTNAVTGVLASIRDSSVSGGKSRPYGYLSSNNEFKLPGGYTFAVSGWGVTRSFTGAFERNALFAVDTSISKTFFDKLNCSIRFNDMFRSVTAEQKFVVNDVAASGVFYDRQRELAVSVKYSFGKLKESRYKNKDVDENGSRVR